MPNVTLKLVGLSLTAAVVAACQQAPDRSTAADQEMAIDDNSAGRQSGNIDIETLPADESSDASNAELSTGAVDPDGADNFGNSGNAE